MAMIGLPKSSSFMPVARHRPRAPAMLRPWVVVLERYAGMGLSFAGQKGRRIAPAAVVEVRISRRSVAAVLVDQLVLRDPRHHGAQLGADILDRMLGQLGTGRLERGDRKSTRLNSSH